MILRICMALTAAACAAAAVAAAPDCVPQTQVDVATIDRQIVLVGEAHGTNEIPDFVAGLVCSLLGANRAVILGIEHDGNEQEALNRFVSSDGSAADRAALLASSANWRSYADGRGSEAMYRLVDAMRRLRRQGQRVGVLAIQRNANLDVPMEDADRVRLSPSDNALQNRDNDASMASGVLHAATLYRRYVVVVLAGYSHTSTAWSTRLASNPSFGAYAPMGMLVEETQPALVIGVRSDGGEHAGTGAGGSRTYALGAGPLWEDAARIDAEVRIGRVTPSPPARDTTP